MCHKYNVGSKCDGSAAVSTDSVLYSTHPFDKPFCFLHFSFIWLIMWDLSCDPTNSWDTYFFFTWTSPPLDQAFSDLGNVRAGFAKGRRVLQDLPCAGLLAPLEATCSTRLRARAPLAPFTHLAMHWQGGNMEKEKFKDHKYFPIFEMGSFTFQNVVAKTEHLLLFFYNISTLTLDWPCGVHSMSFSLGS